jgi:hypothetical protein
MYPPVQTSDPTAVQVEVQAAYLEMFANPHRLFVPRVFGWAIECFTGHYADYQAVDAQYHDFEHTLQGTLCMVRLLLCRARAGAKPAINRDIFELALMAILLHDTGYLKKRSDREGTGAKYTTTHVTRSAEFAGKMLAEKGLTEPQIASVKNMIRCTGLSPDSPPIAFQSEAERIAGFALATGDILGQMAADDYVEKLPTLYSEFVEAARFTGDKAHAVASFSSASDLIEKTPAFWQDTIHTKLEAQFGGLYRFLNQPFPAGPNYYLQRIEFNMARIKKLVTA